MIQVENLVFNYPNVEVPTIKGISFEISQGEIYGFLGPSGAGKSTTQKVLIRILRNFSGNIQILGNKLQNWQSDYYNHIGVGFELPNHYLKLTAKENLEFFASFYDKSVLNTDELLEQVGLLEAKNKRVEEFSKGMKMRLNFIRAIMHDPEILFFDEPTSGLDPVNARILKDIILEEKKKGKTIFLTTHNMHDADELCDKVAFIIDGKIMESDSPKTLKINHGSRKVLVEVENHSVNTTEFEMDGLGENIAFLDLIKNNNIKSIHSKEASLEDIFIQLTGKSLV